MRQREGKGNCRFTERGQLRDHARPRGVDGDGGRAGAHGGADERDGAGGRHRDVQRECDGDGAAGYQWFFNSTNQLDGVTNASLTVTNARPGQEGGYRVVVTNVAGSVTSAAAALTGLVPPTVTGQRQAQLVVLGGAANFAVSATGTGSLSYQWWLTLLGGFDPLFDYFQGWPVLICQ